MGRESGLKEGQGKMDAQVQQRSGGFENIQGSSEPECAAHLFGHGKMVKRVAQGYTKPSLAVIWIQVP